MSTNKHNSGQNRDETGKVHEQFKGKLFPIKGYIIINLIFWSYCILQILALKWLLKDIVGLIFFFIVLGSGFTLVSIYDCAWDRIAMRYSRNKGEKRNL